MAKRAGSGGAKVVSIRPTGRRGGRRTAEQVIADGAEADAKPNGPDDDLVLRYIARMDAQDAVIAQALAQLNGQKKIRNTIRLEAKTDRIKLKNLDAARERSKLPRFEQREDIVAQDRYDRILGNETWEAADLFTRMPEAAKDEVDVEAMGYAAGLRCLPDKPPEAYAAGPMLQPWLRGHERGVARFKAAMSPNKNADLDGAKGDGFEAGEGEIGKQTARKVVKAKREADAPAADEALFTTEDA